MLFSWSVVSSRKLSICDKNDQLMCFQRSRLWMCLYRYQSVCRRVCPSLASRKFRRHGLPIWLPTWDTHRFLDWLWDVFPQLSIQYCMACVEHRSNTHWSDLRRNQNFASKTSPNSGLELFKMSVFVSNSTSSSPRMNTANVSRSATWVSLPPQACANVSHTASTPWLCSNLAALPHSLYTQH